LRREDTELRQKIVGQFVKLWFQHCWNLVRNPSPLARLYRNPSNVGNWAPPSSGALIFEFAEVFLKEGQVLLEGLLQLALYELTHRAAFEESGVPEGFCQSGL
jgi:hypothetical protein